MRAMVIAALLLASAPAFGSPASDAFNSGRFAEAAVAGRKEATVRSLILAGRAVSTVAAFETADKTRARALLLEAEQDFDAALALQPGNATALLQKAIAIGYRAKLDNSIGLAKDARRSFEAILLRRPDDALALGAMGGWHGESVATLGKFLAGVALGARESEGLKYYDRAVAAPGADPAVPVFYAITLLNLSAANATKAEALLRRAVKARPTDGFDRLMQQQARAILEPLETGNVAAARAAAQRLSPFGTVR